MDNTDISKVFNETKAYEYFKRIRNRLRKHYPEEIVISCIRRLNFVGNNQIQEMQEYPPWFLYLLIKWTVKYGEYSSPDRKNLSEKDFRYLINLIHEYFGIQRGPLDYGGIHLFLRTIAFQQFWVQEDFTAMRLGRQSLLFGKLPPNHYFQTVFYEITKVSISDFLELLFALLSRFIVKKEYYVTQDWFAKLEKSYSEGTISKFLSILALNLDDLKTYLNSLPTVSCAYEFHEQTPLRRYPLQKVGDKYFIYSTELLSASVQNIVYEIIRGYNPSKFMEKFGLLFERYIRNGLDAISACYKTEADLKYILNPEEKIIDYLIMEPKANIFIDAKGVELGHLGMVSHLPEIVTDKTKTSILKGIEQYYSTVEQLNKNEQFSIRDKENYLLIITYKDLFLGNGKDYFDNIAKDKYNLLEKKYPTSSFLLTENMYFVSIDDFDLMIEIANRKNMLLSEILGKAVESDRSNSTKKFLFRQHIFEYDREINSVSYLGNEFNDIATRCANKLTE